MRLEQRIVLDGAASIVVEHAVADMLDTTPLSDTAHTAEHGDVSPPAPKEPAGDDANPAVLVANASLADAGDLLAAAQDDVITVEYSGQDRLNDILDKIETALGDNQAAAIGFAAHSLGAGTLHLTDQIDIDTTSLLTNPQMASFWKNIGALVQEDGRLDLMGCDIAKGDAGQAFVDTLEEVSGRDVAASDDATGNPDQGDWILENGNIDLMQNYFDAQRIQQFDGSLADAIIVNGAEFSDTDNDGYYEIDTKEKLIALSQDTTKWENQYELTADIEFDSDERNVDWNGDGKVNADDVDAGGKGGFSPIGTEVNEFTGKFKGNDHTISHLYINSDAPYVGLFGVVHGRLSDIGLKDVDITATGGRVNAGGLAGYARRSAISNIYTTGSVSVTATIDEHVYAGGLTGFVLESAISNNYATVSVSVSVAATGGDHHVYVGGLAGMAVSNMISNSYAVGSVTANSNDDIYAGGLAGWASSSEIINIYAAGSVSVTATGDDGVNAGGLAGSVLQSAISNSYATGNVAANGGNDNNVYAGGLVGSADAAYISNNYAPVVPGLNRVGNDANAGTGWKDSKQEVYAAWDDSIWQKPAAGSDENPTLIWRIQIPFSDSDGDGYFEIHTQKELIALSQDSRLWLNRQYELTADIEFDADHTQVDWDGDGDVDADDAKGFSPIGNKDKAGVIFSGDFKGNGHHIFNLYLCIDSNAPYVGLFGNFGYGELSGVGLEDVDITVTGVNVYAGGLVGRAWASEISNSYAAGSVTATGVNVYAGGLVGMSWDSETSNSYAVGSVTATGDDDVNAGGLAGSVFQSEISNSYATGSVTANGGNHSNVDAGGLVGVTTGSKISNSYATGSVTATGDSVCAGGLVGRVEYSEISNSYAPVVPGLNKVGNDANAGTGWKDSKQEVYGDWDDAIWKKPAVLPLAISFVEGGDALHLLEDNALILSDPELKGLRPIGDWRTVVLTIARENAASNEDVFGLPGSGNTGVNCENNTIRINEDVIGTFTNENGMLSITFGQNITTDQVNTVVGAITYKNTKQCLGQNESESFHLLWTFGTPDKAQTILTQAITITGVNNGPVISINAGDSDSASLTETDDARVANATLSVTDPEISDTVSASVTSVSASGITTGLESDNDALKAMLTVNNSVIANDATTGTINWSFDSGTEAFNYLAEGEHLILTYTVRATDSNGATDDHNVVITITGTYDTPANTAPTAVDDTVHTDEKTSVTGNVLTNDTDAEQMATP